MKVLIAQSDHYAPGLWRLTISYYPGIALTKRREFGLSGIMATRCSKGGDSMAAYAFLLLFSSYVAVKLHCVYIHTLAVIMRNSKLKYGGAVTAFVT